MAIEITISEAIVFIKAEGEFSLQLGLERVHDILEGYNGEKKLKIMIYDNHSSFNGSADIMKKILRLFSQNQDKLTKDIAVVATGVLQFGLANMFSVYASMLKWNIETFREYDHGLEWLNRLP